MTLLLQKFCSKKDWRVQMANNRFKKLIKFFIPATCWENLRYFKKWKKYDFKLNKFYKNNWFKDLFIFSKTFLKQTIKITDNLDYRSTNKIKMNIDSCSELTRLNACKKEPETAAWINQNVKPGDVFYDIGANVGAYSFVAMEKTNRNCKVYAFEPSFSNFNELSQNIFLNQYQEKIIPLHIALSDKTSLFPFYYSDIKTGSAGHALKNPVDETGKNMQPVFIQPIISYTLDEFIEKFKIEKPNLIKIDVDGAEMDILKGAEKTLREPNLKSVLIEINESINSEQTITTLMANFGLRLESKHSRMRSKILFNYIFSKK